MERVEEKKMLAIKQTESEKAELFFSGQERQTLDPSDWEGFRTQAHRMLDDILDYTENVRRRPVWQPIPDEVRARFGAALPAGPLLSPKSTRSS